jgi:predicted nucleotidyltransferase
VATLTHLRRKLRPILERYHIRRAILFGSLARGEDTRRSDVLILVQETDKRFLTVTTAS